MLTLKTLTTFCLLMVLASTASATSLTLWRQNSHLGVRLQKIHVPGEIQRELASGLSNRWLMNLTLTVKGVPIQERNLEFSLKYDLWDEVYRLVLRIDDQERNRWQFATAEQFLQFFGLIKIPELFDASQLVLAEPVSIRLRLLINPVSKERMEKIKAWVTQNSITVPSTQGGFPNGRVPNGIRTNTLFNKIYEEFENGKSLSSAWSEDFSTPLLKLSEVPIER